MFQDKFIVKFNNRTPDFVSYDWREAVLHAGDAIEQGKALIASVMCKNFWRYTAQGVVHTSEFTGEVVYTPACRLKDLRHAKWIIPFKGFSA